MGDLPSRQIHLDFHTSEHIPDVGREFDADRYVQVFVEAGVESVVTFAKCHHGWSYYDTEIGQRHPSLEFDLLRAQFDACKQAGLKVPVYVSVGWDERAMREHQDWRQIQPNGQFFCLLGSNLDAAWSYACLNSPYLDELCAQIEEVVQQFPDADGLWLDIIKQDQCCCVHCRKSMSEKGLDFLVEEDRVRHAQDVVRNYYQRALAAAREHAPDMGVFHNTAMVPRGDRSLFDAYSHMEIEAVPTGGWGYDHLPMSAKYLGAIGYDPMGVTVRFHIVWGELGGYKTVDGLRYEAMTMLAHGARVCIGDQLHPSGIPDASAYRMIGKVFAEVREKWPLVANSSNVADIAILSSTAVREPGAVTREARHCPEDEGALKILQESHFLFDVIDQHCDFDRYRLCVLPDHVKIDEGLAAKLQTYLDQGGKLLLTGESGMSSAAPGFGINVPAALHGLSEYNPTFLLPRADLAPADVTDPFIFMAPSLRITASDGARSLGAVFEPYFNRTPHHFNGHINAPPRREPSVYDCGVSDGRIAYLPHFHFSLYRQLGHSTVRKFVANVVRDLLGQPTVELSGFPASGVATLRHQPDQRRYVLHLLYGAPRLRGSTVLGPLEAIDDAPILAPTDVTLHLDREVCAVTNHSGDPVYHMVGDDGACSFLTGPIDTHSIYLLEY